MAYADTIREGGLAFDRQSDGNCGYFLFGSTPCLSWHHASCESLVGNTATFTSFHRNYHRLPHMAIHKPMEIDIPGFFMPQMLLFLLKREGVRLYERKS
jgi:hypothetical protein